MPKTLYLIRHGETLFNLHNKVQGWCDSPLTEAGIEQARAAGRRLAARGVDPDTFVCSTAERASDTLELMMAELGHAGEPYERLKGIKEFNHGAFEGEPQYLQPERDWYPDFYARFGGEDDGAVKRRMAPALDAVMAREKTQVALAVSHAGALFSFAEATGADVHRLFPMDNATCCVYSYDPSRVPEPVAPEDLARRFELVDVIHPE